MPTILVSATQLLGKPLALLVTSMPPCESACFFLMSVLGGICGKGIFGSHQLCNPTVLRVLLFLPPLKCQALQLPSSEGLAESWYVCSIPESKQLKLLVNEQLCLGEDLCPLSYWLLRILPIKRQGLSSFFRDHLSLVNKLLRRAV